MWESCSGLRNRGVDWTWSVQKICQACSVAWGGPFFAKKSHGDKANLEALGGDKAYSLVMARQSPNLVETILA